MIFTDLNLDRKREIGYFSYVCAVLTMFILPIQVKYVSPIMILWLICWIFENYQKLSNIKKSGIQYSLLFIFSISYYLWQCAGLIYSDDIEMGLSNIFGRISMMIFPIVLILPGESVKSRLKFLLNVFAFSTFIYLVFCYGFAAYRSISVVDGEWIINPHPQEIWLNYFYGAELMIKTHPSYFSMYALLSLFISFEQAFDNGQDKRRRIMWFIIGLILLISQYFISSRAGILISLILVPVYFMNKLRKIRFARIGIIVLFLALIPVILKNQRVDYFFGKVLNTQVDYERKEDPRFKIWESSVTLVKKNILLGVGIGDVRNELVLQYIKDGEEEMAHERYNAHNQFLETMLESGLVGFLLFISVFATMSYIAVSERNILYGYYILIVLLFFMFETVLYRLAGITFFSIFSFLLLYYNNSTRPAKM